MHYARYARLLALIALSGRLHALEAPPAQGVTPAAALYFPTSDATWQTVTPASVGWNAEALRAALEYAGDQRSSGVVILHRGRILGERFWKLERAPDDPLDRVHKMITGRTADGQVVEDVASVQKSVLSLLAGIARGRKLLDFEAPVSRYLGEGWSKAAPAQEAAITVRHLLGMTTGLAMDGSYEAPPGTRWLYNTPVSSKIVQILERASGLEVDEYTRQWLTDPIGMSDSRWTARSWIEEAGAGDGNTIGFSSSARDLARFGLLVLADGRWNRHDVLADPDYLSEALTSSQTHNPAYGLLWWLNGKPRLGPGGKLLGQLVETAPSDLVAAQGALGRKVYVVPSLGLVVTRIGDEPPAKDFGVDLWRRLMAAAPARSAKPSPREPWP
jgi:CubicO group peptidase (beta-lactamase class C family)